MSGNSGFIKLSTGFSSVRTYSRGPILLLLRFSSGLETSPEPFAQEPRLIV